MDTINFSASQGLQKKNTQKSKERKFNEIVREKEIKEGLQYR